MKNASFILSLFLVVSSFGGEWTDLFNGKNLDGWTKKGGAATYAVENGVIVGTTKPNTPNTFICPDKQFGDFELTFEVKCDPALNSGVQIRSTGSAEGIPAGTSEKGRKKAMDRVKGGSLYGPQVEIAANGNAGGVWFEAVGGWLLEPKPELTKTVYKNNDWNSYRILVNGTQIQVWVNGVKISDGQETMTKMTRGFLGFQVHGIGKRTDTYQVRWKNIKIRELN